MIQATHLEHKIYSTLNSFFPLLRWGRERGQKPMGQIQENTQGSNQVGIQIITWLFRWEKSDRKLEVSFPPTLQS